MDHIPLALDFNGESGFEIILLRKTSSQELIFLARNIFRAYIWYEYTSTDRFLPCPARHHVRSEKMTRMVTSSCSPHVNPNTKQWCSHMRRRPAPRPVYSASSQAYYVSRTLMENELGVIWFATVIEAAERWTKMDVHIPCRRSSCTCGPKDHKHLRQLLKAERHLLYQRRMGPT